MYIFRPFIDDVLNDNNMRSLLWHLIGNVLGINKQYMYLHIQNLHSWHVAYTLGIIALIEMLITFNSTFYPLFVFHLSHIQIRMMYYFM